MCYPASNSNEKLYKTESATRYKYLVEKWYIAQHQHEEKGTYIGPF